MFQGERSILDSVRNRYVGTPRPVLDDILYLFRCPDDQNRLILSKGSYLECDMCKRTFRIFSDNLIELLPSRPFPFTGPMDNPYLETYNRLLVSKFEFNPLAVGWGDLSKSKKGYKAFVKAQWKVIQELLGNTIKGTFCDVSGGCGNYSLHFSYHATLMVHCDLDVNSINNAYEKSKGKPGNMLFVRSDYLQMPFSDNAFDSIICIDTLERGHGHEVRLLAEILRCLSRRGKFVVDFHNEGRTSRLLVPSLREKNTAYDYNAIEIILNALKVHSYSIQPFGFVPTSMLPLEKLYRPLDRLLALLRIPSSRWIVVGEK